MRFPSRLLLLLTLASCAYLSAQETQLPDSSSRQGEKALTFVFNYAALGGGLGATFWIRSDYSIRVSVTGSFNFHKYLNDNETTTDNSVAMTAYLRKHFHTSSSLSPYVGGGIGVGYDASGSNYYGLWSTARSGFVRVPFVAGAEYWISKEISLSGEQSVAFSFDINDRERLFTVSASTSSLLLSVYF